LQQLFKNLVGKKTFVKELRKGEERKLEINGIINICLAVFLAKLRGKRGNNLAFFFIRKKTFNIKPERPDVIYKSP
jgi:hypothetical protein